MLIQIILVAPRMSAVLESILRIEGFTQSPFSYQTKRFFIILKTQIWKRKTTFLMHLMRSACAT